METISESPRSRRMTMVCVLALVILLLLPLMGLALIDIMQGGEDLALEWWVVSVGLVAIGIAQVVVLSLLWRRGR